MDRRQNDTGRRAGGTYLAIIIRDMTKYKILQALLKYRW